MMSLMRRREAERGWLLARGPVVSAGLHGAAVLALVLVAAKAPRVERVRLPGSSAGKHLLLSYTLGGQESAKASALPKKQADAKVKAPVPSP